MKVPEPRKLPSGKWFIQLRVGGASTPITEDTAEKCRAHAMAIKSGLIELEAPKREVTLRKAIDKYISSRDNILSPATIKGYRTVQNHRFQNVADKPLREVKDWEAVVNAEAKLCSPKTLKNSWMFVKTVLRKNGVNAKAALPPVPKADRPWLTPEQIAIFVPAVHGKPCEIGALLALHGLRRSEIFGLTWDRVDLAKGTIRIQGAIVIGEHNKPYAKETNKNESSTRTIHIIIPELRAVLEATENKTGSVCTGSLKSLYGQINRICEASGLPKVGIHGLRHSFASLCYHLGLSEIETMKLGGWADQQTMHKIYTHLSELDRQAGDDKLENFYKSLTSNANSHSTYCDTAV